MVIMYLAHPVAPLPHEIDLAIEHFRSDDGKRFSRDAAAAYVINRNVDNALAWLTFLVVHTGWSISAPWIPYVLALDDGNPAHRARGTHDSQAMARRATGVVLVGGRTSGGMRQDAAACPGPMLDLTDIGRSPPVPMVAGVSQRWVDELAERWTRVAAA